MGVSLSRTADWAAPIRIQYNESPYSMCICTISQRPNPRPVLRERFWLFARVGAGAARSTGGALIHKKAPDLPRVVM